VRTLYWGKQAKQLDEQGIPRRYETTSRLCILANSMARVEENLAAVLDRAFVLRFQPSVDEVHRHVGTWFPDTEIHGFVGKHLAMITRPSIRFYRKAEDLKRVNADWRGWLIKQWVEDEPQLAVVASVLADPSLTTAAQRVKRFAELGGGSRATFMRTQSRYRDLTGSKR
jgi:hypothetical protein